MSKTGNIIIETSFINKKTYLAIFNTLIDNGWTVNRDNYISFMVNGTYDWKSETYINLDKVLDSISTSIDNELEANIDLSWGDSEIGIGLMYSKPNEIVFLIAENILLIEPIGIIDFTWYLNRIMSVFNIIRFDGIICNYG